MCSTAWAQPHSEKSLCKSSSLWPKFSVPIRWHWSCCCYKKKCSVVASQSCSYPRISQQNHFHIFCGFFSWLSGYRLLHSALLDISKMALIIQVAKNVGSAGLAAGCGAITLSYLPPDILLSAEIRISLMYKTLAGHKRDCETFSLPPLQNSAQTPFLPLCKGEQWLWTSVCCHPHLDKIGSLRSKGF